MQQFVYSKAHHNIFSRYPYIASYGQKGTFTRSVLQNWQDEHWQQFIVYASYTYKKII